MDNKEELSMKKIGMKIAVGGGGHVELLRWLGCCLLERLRGKDAKRHSLLRGVKLFIIREFTKLFNFPNCKISSLGERTTVRVQRVTVVREGLIKP